MADFNKRVILKFVDYPRASDTIYEWERVAPMKWKLIETHVSYICTSGDMFIGGGIIKINISGLSINSHPKKLSQELQEEIIAAALHPNRIKFFKHELIGDLH